MFYTDRIVLDSCLKRESWSCHYDIVKNLIVNTKDVFLPCSLLTLFKEARSSITLESVLEKHTFASTHTHPLRNVVEKTITMGKLEYSVNVHNFIYLLL